MGAVRTGDNGRITGGRPARDAIVVALLGDPGDGLLPPAELDLPAFWRRFDAAAPAHLRVGMAAATVLVAGVLPRLLGHRCGLAGLDADRADAVVQRAARLPVLGLTVEVAKIVACFAYFSDERVDQRVRARRATGSEE